MPPFFIPIAAFLAWAAFVFLYFPALRLGLSLAHETVAAQLFVSHLILILAWAFSGPITAAILSVLSALVVLYLSLVMKEPSLFVQVLIYAGMFFFTASCLYEVQRKVSDKRIRKEKLNEDIHLTREENAKNARLAQALDRKIDVFLDLHRFSEELRSVQGVSEITQKITLEARQVFGKADECVLYLVDESQQELSLAASWRKDGEPIREKQGSLYDQWVMKRYRPVVIEDTRNDFRFPTDKRAETENLRAVCASPLMTENKVLGVLRVSAGQPNAFTPDDLRLLDVISGLGAVSLRNRLLYQKMEELALRDSLTGLYLNRYFQERLSLEVSRAKLGKGHFSLLLLDIDHFKLYNDEYGHSAGDIVLKNIAQILNKALTSSDLVARYGGEEFVMFLPNKKKKEAVAVAEKIRVAIEQNPVFLRRVAKRVTASVGVSTYPEDGETAEALIRAADKRLYVAKNAGRNQVCGNT